MGVHKRIIKYYKSETKGMNINEIKKNFKYVNCIRSGYLQSGWLRRLIW